MKCRITKYTFYCCDEQYGGCHRRIDLMRGTAIEGNQRRHDGNRRDYRFTIVNGLRINAIPVYLIKYSRANRTSHKDIDHVPEGLHLFYQRDLGCLRCPQVAQDEST